MNRTIVALAAVAFVLAAVCSQTVAQVVRNVPGPTTPTSRPATTKPASLPAKTVAAPAAKDVALGSPDFVVTPQRPVGWRGDWTGRFPAATPPTTWERKGNAGKNIIWASRMPENSVASPIIVGDRIFVCSEPYDLVCLDKKTGNVLWVRSTTEYEGLTDDERKDFPADAKSNIEPLVAKLPAANDAIVKALGGDKKALDGTLGAKRDINKKVYDILVGVDKKKYDRNWAQAVFGFAGCTPCSDGKLVYVFFTTGVTAAFDFDGNRKWAARGRGMGAEHGNFASPIVIGGKVVVWAGEMRAYDCATGKLDWNIKGDSGNTYGSMFPMNIGGVDVAAHQTGMFVKVKDGVQIWGNDRRFGDATPTPIVDDGMIFALVGYPRNSEGLGFKSFKADGAEGKLTVVQKFNTAWDGGELGNDKKFERGMVASPLYVDGLIYTLTEGGGLMVNDAKTGEMVYKKVLDMKPRTDYWAWAGASASPTLAGKYIYLMDNQGQTIVIEPGKQYKEVARSMIENRRGNDQEQNLTCPWFEGTRMYYRGAEYVYCIGEK